MLTKLSASTSKIPVRDLTPMFNTMEESNRSRRQTFSASFNPPRSAIVNAEIKKEKYEKIHKLNAKNKELKNMVGFI